VVGDGGGGGGGKVAKRAYIFSTCSFSVFETTLCKKKALQLLFDGAKAMSLLKWMNLYT